MSRNLAGFERTWRLVAYGLMLVVGIEAWYIRQLSGALIEQRFAQSAGLDRHLSDRFALAQLKRQMKAMKEAQAAGPRR